MNSNWHAKFGVSMTFGLEVIVDRGHFGAIDKNNQKISMNLQYLIKMIQNEHKPFV